MASVGDYISQSNLPGTYTSWTYGAKNVTIYICAPCWRCEFYQKTAGIITKTMSVEIYKWDGVGTTSFTKVFNNQYTTQGSSTTRYAYHNYSGSGIYSDTSDIHIWKVFMSSDYGSNGSGHVYVYGYDVGASSNSNSNTYKSGNLVRGCYIDGAVYTGSTVVTSYDESFINAHLPTILRGTEITTSNCRYCYTLTSD